MGWVGLGEGKDTGGGGGIRGQGSFATELRSWLMVGFGGVRRTGGNAGIVLRSRRARQEERRARADGQPEIGQMTQSDRSVKCAAELQNGAGLGWVGFGWDGLGVGWELGWIRQAVELRNGGGQEDVSVQIMPGF